MMVTQSEGARMELASFSERVLLNSERLTDFEEEFSKYVMANPEEASAQTVTSLAQRFYVAPNSIVRFARKLGYTGFSDMRFSLGKEMELRQLAERQRTSKELPSSLELVNRTFELCCKPKVEKRAAKMLAEADRVAFFAVGETAYAAHTFARLFEEFDNKTQFITYENQMRREIARGDGLVVVLVSLSGETAQILGAASVAKDAGVPIISVTDLHPCSLTRYATLSLYCCSPQKHLDGINVTDLTPLFAALTSLENAYYREIGVLPPEE